MARKTVPVPDPCTCPRSSPQHGQKNGACPRSSSGNLITPQHGQKNGACPRSCCVPDPVVLLARKTVPVPDPCRKTVPVPDPCPILPAKGRTVREFQKLPELCDTHDVVVIHTDGHTTGMIRRLRVRESFGLPLRWNRLRFQHHLALE